MAHLEIPGVPPCDKKTSLPAFQPPARDGPSPARIIPSLAPLRQRQQQQVNESKRNAREERKGLSLPLKPPTAAHHRDALIHDDFSDPEIRHEPRLGCLVACDRV